MSSALVEKDNLPREAKKTNDSTFDRIYKYYHNNKSRVELSKEEEQIRERWEKAWFLLSRHRTQKQVVELVQKLFNVGKSVAYDDLRNAMMLFSNPQNDLKDAKRAIAETMAMNGANKCWKENDMEGYSKFLKLYIELNGLTSADENTVGEMMKKMKPTQIILNFRKEEVEREAEKLHAQLAQDVEFEELENE